MQLSSVRVCSLTADPMQHLNSPFTAMYATLHHMFLAQFFQLHILYSCITAVVWQSINSSKWSFDLHTFAWHVPVFFTKSLPGLLLPKATYPQSMSVFELPAGLQASVVMPTNIFFLSEDRSLPMACNCDKPCIEHLWLPAEAAELIQIAQGLSAIAPTKALWKLSESDLVAFGNGSLPVGSNVKIVQWAPQNDVLGHPSVKAFFTQGGANSFNEVSMLIECHAAKFMHEAHMYAVGSMHACPVGGPAVALKAVLVTSAYAAMKMHSNSMWL